MKLLTIIGARPQFIKAAVVSRAIADFNKKNKRPLKEVIVHTGQHYDNNMSKVFFQEMNIPEPDYDLGVSGVSHGAMTGRMLERIEEVLLSEKPDAVVVYGDTNSTLAGALAAVKLHIPVAHVEAGLRSFNMRMPEEVNRIMTDRISTWLFCPSERAVRNLSMEGIPGASLYGQQHVVNVGDVMFDAFLYYSRIGRVSQTIKSIRSTYACGYFLATLHRAENTDDISRLKSILMAFEEIAQTTPVLFPVHPRTRKIIEKLEVSIRHIHLLEPVGYFDMLHLLKGCRGVMTDSGGLQKEAYFLSKPCLTLRDETEWIELVECGANILTGADRERIIHEAARMDSDASKFTKQPYGNGNAGRQIIDRLIVDLQ